MQTCTCTEDLVLFAIGMAPLAIIVLIAGIAANMLPDEPRTIEVNGQMCVVRFKETGQTSHGALYGHDVVDMTTCK